MLRVQPKLLLALAALTLFGCASAGKRYEQGMELEAKGRYEGATVRYAQALEKDPHHGDARTRLQRTGEMAIAQRLEDADRWAARNELVTAATQYHSADAVWNQARNVGVRLTLPPNYDTRRRNAFDDAVAALQESGDAAREQGRWHEGVGAYRQARDEFEPSREQRDELLRSEAGLLINWSESEYERGHLRAAFDVASQVQALEWSPEDESTRAASIMADALREGEVELLVLPIGSAQRSRRHQDNQHVLLSEIDAALTTGPWRQPPPFVDVKDPLAVRDLVRHTGVLDGEVRAAAMATLLRLAESDYGAMLHLLSSEESEVDVRSTTRTSTTKDGRSVTYVQVEGNRRIQATARVLLVDHFGNAIADVTVAGSGTAPFSRGVYEGDAKELRLDSRLAQLFDRFEQEAQTQAAQRALAMSLATNVADAVFGNVLAQIP